MDMAAKAVMAAAEAWGCWQCTPPLTEPGGNAGRSSPTVKMMGTAFSPIVARQHCSVSPRTRQGHAPKGVAGYHCLRLRLQEQPWRSAQSVKLRGISSEMAFWLDYLWKMLALKKDFSSELAGFDDYPWNISDSEDYFSWVTIYLAKTHEIP